MSATDDRQLSRAFAEAPVGLAIADPAGRFVHVNRAFAAILGQPPDELGSKCLDDVVVDRDGSTAREARRAALSRQGAPVPTDVRLARADGEERWACLWLAPLPGDGSTPLLITAQDIDERKRHEEDLRRRSLQDPLTGLANRALLLDRLQHALERRTRARCGVAVLFIDIDDFKGINDTHGHAAGDEVLVALAERLPDCLRYGDTVARIGGDEFVVVCESVLDPDEVDAVVARVRTELQRPLPRWGGALPLSLSVGSALAERREPASAEELLRRADAAMYADKLRRRGRAPAAPGAHAPGS